MSESYNSQYMRDPAAAIRQRKYAMAQALQKAGSDTSPVVGTGNTTMQALARVLQGGIGAYLGSRVEGEAQAASDEQKAERKRTNDLIAHALMPGGSPPATAPVQGGPDPSPPPAMTDRLGGAPPVEPPAPVPQVQQQPLGPLPGGMYGRNAGAVAGRDATLDAPPQVLADASAQRAQQTNGLPPGTQYRANPGVEGVFAGLPAPSGAVPALAPGGAAPASVAPPAAAAPSGDQRTPDQLRQAAARVFALGGPEAHGAAAILNSRADAMERRAFTTEDRTDARRLQAEAEARRAEERRADNARADAQLELARAAARRAEDEAGTRRATAPYQPDPANAGRVIPTPGGPADPAVIEAAARARGEGRGGRVIPGHERNSILEASTRISETTALRDSFKPEYGGSYLGVIGDARNFLGRNTPGESPQADWWSRYQSQKNQVRNALFGASLTPGEQREYEKADINPGMSAEAIRTNLARQAEIITTAQRRRVRSMAADGYNTRALQEASGIDPDEAPVTPQAAAPAAPGGAHPPLPPGFTVVQ